MLLHHETYRLLVRERMNHYLHEAASDRRTRIAAVGGERAKSRFVQMASALVLAAARILAPHLRAREAPCAETCRTAR